jgi:hypothetical protein
MLHDLRFNDVRLLARYPMVFSMEFHQLILHEAVPTPQKHKEAHFSGVYSTATAVPPVPVIRRHPPFSTGLKNY